MNRAGLPLVCAVLLVALGGAACRTAYPLQRTIPPGLTAAAVVIYPVGFRWPEPEWRVLALGQRLVDEALAEAGDTALFFGPSEVRVYRPEDDNAWVASDAVARLVPWGLRPAQALVLRPWVERRVQSGVRELQDAEGRARGQGSVEETTYLGYVEVLHPSSGQRLIEVRGQVVVDPFAEHSTEGADAMPELTRLMADLTRAALEALAGHLSPPRSPPPALATVALVPWEAYKLEPELAALDVVDAELVRQQRLQFANPQLTPGQVARLARLPAGLYVLEAPAEGKLAVGELVTRIEEAPALPQTLARIRFAPTPVQARVRLPEGSFTERVLP